MEDINALFYTCLWEQFIVRKEFDYTYYAFLEPEAEIRNQMFPSWSDYVFNVTETVSTESALAWNSCTQMTLNSYIWGLDFKVKFEAVDVNYDYLTSMMQNIILNIIYLTQLNFALQNAAKTEDLLMQSYLIGRIVRTVFIIEPLPLDAFLDEIGTGTYDFDELRIQAEREIAEMEQEKAAWQEQGKHHLGAKRLLAPPEYKTKEEMNYFYIALFLVEGFG